MFSRSYRLDTLHHKFLKPKSIPIDRLEEFAVALWEAKFIDFVPNKDQRNPNIERYADTDKMTSREHRDELFKIVESFK